MIGTTGLLADVVVVLHVAFILFVAIGSVLAWRWPRLVWLHAPALTWAAGIVVVGYPCPLTWLERALRGRTADGGFVDRYLENVIYPEELTPLLRGLAVVLVVVGYVGLMRAPRARQPVKGSVPGTSSTPDIPPTVCA